MSCGTRGCRECKTLPKRCECGGRILYSHAFGRTFSCCDTCTPVVTVDLRKHRAARERGAADG